MSDRKQQIANFLEKIKQIESSGGKDFSHDEIQSGIHAGTSAAGNFGIMPNTATELVGRMERVGPLPQGLEQLKTMPPDQIKSFIETNPDQEKQLAEYLAGHVLDKQQGDEEKAAYSWQYGHNLTPDKLQKRPYKDSDYVKKFNNLKKLMGK